MAHDRSYDVIVVGARCAGSPTAMLLARLGHRVLLVDRDDFPSDTISTQMIHPPGIRQLQKWHLLDRLAATGCPVITRYKFDFGFFTIAGRPQVIEDVNIAYGPRRTVLDKLLIDAAAEAGATVREGFIVDGLLFDDGQVSGVRGHSRGGQSVLERARVVVGADGRNSLVAKAVTPEQYHDKPPLECGYYTYWSDLPTSGFENYIRQNRGWGVIPTHDNLTLVVVGWPYAEFESNRKDVEGCYMSSLELAPEFAARVRDATRQAPFKGAAVPNFFRKPYGPGWALVGDAGYNKDPLTAWGISDAFASAELCATALDEWITGRSSFDAAMAAYQSARDTHSLAMYELTCGFARLAPPPPEMQQVLHATSATQAAQDQFISMMAGTLPVPSFFAPENIGRIMAAAARA